MPANPRYLIPSKTCRTEIMVSNSRFVATITRVSSANEAREFLTAIRAEMPDASHHVYAFRAGYGNSIIEGMSDAGEPSGTAGAPVLAVLRGANIGDIMIVVTRYFGGTKLGTGGLVRAYTEAARAGLSQLKTEEKIPKQVVGIETPYNFYENIRRLISRSSGTIEDETFGISVTIIASLPADNVPEFNRHVLDLTAGQIQPVLLGES